MFLNTQQKATKKDCNPLGRNPKSHFLFRFRSCSVSTLFHHRFVKFIKLLFFPTCLYSRTLTGQKFSASQDTN